MTVPAPKKLKAERHHWWPEVVSQHWADSAGMAHQVSNDGSEVTSKPSNFGAIRNDNNIQLGKGPTVWDESFEKVFDRADNEFPKVIDWLKANAMADGSLSGPWAKRLSSVVLPDDIHDILAEGLASLIVRSPRFRYCVSLTTNHYRGHFGLTQPADKALIGLNIRHCQKAFRDTIARRGKFALLSSGSSEFIFGDGFFSNFTSSAGPPSSPRCLVPITPEIAVFYTSPQQFRVEPKACSLTLGPEETKGFNDWVQIYSKRFLFYRTLRPAFSPHFLKGEHLQLDRDGERSLDELSVAMGEVRGLDLSWLTTLSKGRN